jgi:hypothetical protein
MGLMSLEVKRQQKLSKSKQQLISKQTENKLLLELKDKLDRYLLDNDRVMLEIKESVLGEFLNILSDKILSIYDYEQVDKTKFIFYNKEIFL